jgi:hypothetical protein
MLGVVDDGAGGLSLVVGAVDDETLVVSFFFNVLPFGLPLLCTHY